MSSHFFALFSRMKYIDRWSLMRNTDSESLSQHSLDVAAIAHALSVIGNKRLGKNYDTAVYICHFLASPEIEICK